MVLRSPFAIGTMLTSEQRSRTFEAARYADSRIDWEQCSGRSATPQSGPIQQTNLVSAPTRSECIGRLQCVGIAVSNPHFSHLNFVGIAISFFSAGHIARFGLAA